MSKTATTWLAVTLFGLGWFGTAFLVHLDDAHCWPVSTAWCWDIVRGWFRHAVSLSWVERYQTLFATAGGAAAILAVFLQRKWQLQAEAERRRESRIQLLHWTFVVLKSVAEAVQFRPIDAANEQIQAANQLLPQLAELHLGIADHIRMALNHISDSLDVDGTIAVPLTNGEVAPMTGHEYAELLVFLWTGYFENPERLIDANGSFVFKRQTAERAQMWLHGPANVDVCRLHHLDMFYEKT